MSHKSHSDKSKKHKSEAHISKHHSSNHKHKEEKSKGKVRDEKEYTKIMNDLKECPFCNMKDKYFIAQDSDVVLTMNLYPYIDYHMMIIPKRHVENLRDLTDKEFIAIRNLNYVATKLLHKKGIKDIHMIYREGSNADRSLGHLHVHMIPYKNKVIAKNPQPLMYEVKETAKKMQKYKDYAKEKLEKIKSRNIKQDKQREKNNENL